MKANYKNWVPKGMLYGFGLGALGCVALFAIAALIRIPWLQWIFGLGAVSLLIAFLWLLRMHRAFSYDGKRQLARQIVEGTAKYIQGISGTILDVGCGSGALTIAAAKNNPKAQVVGIDRWGKEYASFNQKLCEDNAKAEGVKNVSFRQGDATHLDFPDESFDAVTSNYVYHNIVGVSKQDCLRETLRVLKKGGVFAIHDIMSPRRYGDMQAFVKELKDQGYENVQLIDTTDGKLMSKWEAATLDLSGSTLLVGRK